tara:strand:- start:332 stop:547 length:216 start_codon:yes stop_codon:yes gene_type:complete
VGNLVEHKDIFERDFIRPAIIKEGLKCNKITAWGMGFKLLRVITDGRLIDIAYFKNLDDWYIVTIHKLGGK